MKKFCLLAGLMIILCGTAWGTDYVWTGAVAGDWANPNNWDDGNVTPNGYPGQDPGDTAEINDSGASVIISSLIPNALISLTISDGSLNINNFTVDASEIIQNGGTITSSGGTLNVTNVTGTVTQTAGAITGTITINGGIVGLSGPNEITMIDGTMAELNLINTVDLNINGLSCSGGVSLDVAGTVTQTGAIAAGPTLVIKASGMITLDNAITADSITITGNSTIDTDINTTGTQAYNGIVLFNGAGTRTLTGTIVTLGIISGASRNLTVNGNAVFNGGGILLELTVTQNAYFNTALLSASAVNITGVSAINADIRTTGIQNYNGAVTLGGAGARTLTSSSGSVNASSVTGMSLKVEAFGAITVNGPNNVGTVDLSSSNGTISYTGSSAATLTVTANAVGNITITAAVGNITVAAGGAITADNGDVAITASAGNITVAAGRAITANNGTVALTAATGGITVGGAITADGTVDLLAAAGTVTINGTVQTNSSGTEGPGPAGAAVYINAHALSGSPAAQIILNDITDTGEVCVNLGILSVFDGTVTGGRIHYHPPNNVSPTFYYAYTEDSTHTGKIDRIRLQASIDLTDSGSNNGFKIILTDDANPGKSYTDAIIDYQIVSPSDRNSMYVFLNEDKMPCDTGITFKWEITENNRFFDLITGTMPIGKPGDSGATTDTAPPRITHALAVPGYDQIYFQVSEAVTAVTGLTVSVSVKSLSGLIPQRISSREFIVSLGTDFTPDELAGGIEFTLHGLTDSATPAIDKSLLGAPSPRYPQNYNYNAYVTVAGNPPVSGAAVFPDNKSYNLVTGIVAPVNHRATDMLISVPPSDLSIASQHGRFFIWPSWAKYSKNLALNNNSGTIWDFDGKRSLEQQDITLQSRVSDDLTFGGAQRGIIYAFNVPPEYKSTNSQSSPGLWHPGSSSLSGSNPPFVNLVPKFFPTTHPVAMTQDVTAPEYYAYEFVEANYSGLTNPTIEFFYYLAGISGDLLAGRLDMAAGSSIPADWYRRIRPFSFSLRDVTFQRGGVSIYNNVINSEKRERVYLDYKLNKPGRVTVQVFTLDGSLVKALVRENQTASDTPYRVSWDGTNNGGRPVARGMYFIRIVAPDIDEIRKVMVIK